MVKLTKAQRRAACDWGLKPMDTHTAEIPGSISSAELFSQAVATGKKVKFYVVYHNKILIRYATPNGNIVGEEHGNFLYGDFPQFDFRPSALRFTNYWHAYAYGLKLKKEKA